MVFKKKYLVVFLKALQETNLNLVDSRIRDEFHKSLFETTREFEIGQQAIFKEFCIKNKDGEPEMTEKGEYQFNVGEPSESVKKETEILLEEEVELTPKNPAKIKEFLDLTEYKPKVGESEIIDEIIKLF